MKKTLFIIITAFAFIVSCKQKEVVGPAGANGSNGTNGTNGTDGNANVKTLFYKTKESDWVQGGQTWTCTISNLTNLTKSVVDSGLVSISYSAGNPNTTDIVWTPIPDLLPIFDSDSKIAYISFDFEYKLNEVKLKYTYPSNFVGNINPGIKNLKIVTATSTK